MRVVQVDNDRGVDDMPGAKLLVHESLLSEDSK